MQVNGTDLRQRLAAIFVADVAGYSRLMELSGGLRHLAPFVRSHHERWDGRGYPDGLAGETIALEARILNVCDSVEAMASDRPYHVGMRVTDIIAEVRQCANTQFDPAVAAAFLRLVEREGEAFVVNSAHAVQHKHLNAESHSNVQNAVAGWPPRRPSYHQH